MLLQGLALALRSLLIIGGHPEAVAEHDAAREI